MAKKHHELLQDPPTAREEDSSEEASSSEDEEEEAKNPVQTLSSESESGNEPESETHVSPTADSSVLKKTKRQRTEEETTSLSERQAKENDENEIGTDLAKKSYFQRLWTEEDDLVILQGMISFKIETGKSHSEDMDGFYESLKDSLRFEGKNVNRLVNKIRTLRKKYMTKRRKGVAPSFSKLLDQKCFELSESIWGSEPEPKMKKMKLDSSEQMVETDWILNSFIGGSFSSFGVDEERLKEKWSMLPAETKMKVHNKWKLLEGKEMEIVVQKIGFVHEVARLLF